MKSKEEIEKAYWKGYVERSVEAQEICKQCKSRKKAKQLETDKQKLIEKLQEDKLKINEKIKDNIKIINKEWPCKEHLSMNDYFKRKNKLIRENEVLKTKIEYLQEILKILKGENDE